MVRRIALFVLLTPVAATCAASPQRATLTIDVNHVLGPINPLIFGHNVEAGDPFGIFGAEHRYTDTRNGEGFWNPALRSLVPEAVSYAKSVRMGMLRFPGGCLAHGYRWKDAVGPVESRPNFAFGVDEYLATCKAICAEPLMTVSDYSCTPQEAGELVEYLNAPADDAHPWAKKRALWGHPKPYGVRYFEMGNESDHGNHDLLPRRKWTADEYAQWFDDGAARMRAIDPTIKIGALTGTGTGPDDPWNVVLLEKTKPDFVVVHTYPVNVWSPNGPVTDSEDLIMRGCLAAIDQTDAMLAKYRTLIHQKTGRDIPLAITEYNAGLVQEQPKPYRFSFAAALFSADYMGKLLRPSENVLMANYWQFLNGYWGMVQGDKPMPAYELYSLWGRHTGARLVASKVEGPTVEFEGFPGHVKPALGAAYQAEGPVGAANLLKNADLRTQEGNGYRCTVDPGGSLHAALNGVTGEQYPLIAQVAGPLGVSYELSFEARSSGISGSPIGVSILDARGWEPYHSGAAVEGLENAREWTRFRCRFDARPDSAGVVLGWRFRPGASKTSGTIDIRGLQVHAIRPERFPAYPALSSTATLSKDGKTLFLVVANRDPRHAVDATIVVPGVKVGAVKRSTVTAPDLSSTSAQETQSSGGLRQTFPPASMTGIRIVLVRSKP